MRLGGVGLSWVYKPVSWLNLHLAHEEKCLFCVGITKTTSSSHIVERLKAQNGIIALQTHKLTNSRPHLLMAISTHKFISSQTHQLTNLPVYILIRSTSLLCYQYVKKLKNLHYGSIFFLKRLAWYLKKPYLCIRFRERSSLGAIEKEFIERFT